MNQYLSSKSKKETKKLKYIYIGTKVNKKLKWDELFFSQRKKKEC